MNPITWREAARRIRDLAKGIERQLFRLIDIMARLTLLDEKLEHMAREIHPRKPSQAAEARRSRSKHARTSQQNTKHKPRSRSKQ